MARTWCPARSELLWAQILVFGPKIRFLTYDPNSGQRPVCSPQRDGSFPTLRSIFRLFVSELALSVKKDLADASIHLPTVGVLSASNSPSDLSAQALVYLLIVSLMYLLMVVLMYLYLVIR